MATITTDPLFFNNQQTIRLDSISGWDVYAYLPASPTTGIVKTALSTTSGGVLSFSDAGFTAGSTYRVVVNHPTYLGGVMDVVAV
jgi:hypothetical protein